MEEALIKRILPHSIEAEQSVIGSMLMGREAIMAASEILTSDDFYQHQYGVIFDAMVELFNEGKPVDLVTLQNRLREKDVPPEISSMEFAKDLLTAVPTSVNVGHYAKIVKEKAMLRRLIKMNEDIANTCYLDKEPVEEIMEDTQPILVVQRLCAALQPSEVFAEIGVYPVKKGAGLIHVLPSHRNRDVLVLNQIVALCGLVGQDAVVLPAVTVQTVPSLPHQDTALEVRAVETPVVDGDFGSGIRWQAIQCAAIGRKHISLILMGGQCIVDVCEAPCAAELAAGLPDAVPIDLLDGDGLLDAARDSEPLALTSVCGNQRFNHRCFSPSRSEFCSTDFRNGTRAALHIKSVI